MQQRILTNATLLNPDAGANPVDTIAISDGAIQAVGTEEEILGQFPGFEITDLNQAYLLPSFTDAHIHLLKYGLSLQQVNCETDTVTKCLSRVKSATQKTKDAKWVRGHGWNQNAWDGQYGSKHDLDAISPANPVYLTHKSLHCGWANSSALKIAGISKDTPDPEGGIIQRTDSGEPTGVLFESAMRLVEDAIPEPDDADILNALKSAQTALNAFGITSVHDFDPWPVFNALQELLAGSGLSLRVIKSIPLKYLNQVIQQGQKTGDGNDWIKIGWLKIFADGALGPQTAAMLEPYENTDSTGLLLLTKNEITELGFQALSNRIGLAVHAIGDRAVRETLLALSDLDKQNLLRNSKFPSRIEHVQLINENDMPMMKETGVLASMQPIHAISDMDMAERHWGDRCQNAYAWNGISNSGIPLLFGSDAPVESPNPFLGLHASVHRKPFGDPSKASWTGHQQISLLQSLLAYTANPNALCGFQHCGKIAVGFSADMILIPAMPYEDLIESLQVIEPMATMIGGNWVYIKDSINIEI